MRALQWFLYVAVVLLGLCAGCAVSSPTPTTVETLLLSATTAPIPSATVRLTVTVRPSQTPTPTATAVPAGTFALELYPPLVLTYNPAVWQDHSEYANPQQLVNYLQARSLPSCQVSTLGHSGWYPDDLQPLQLGQVKYQAGQVSEADGAIYWAYFEDQSLAGFDYTNGLVILMAKSDRKDWDTCRPLVEELLATLHVAP